MLQKYRSSRLEVFCRRGVLRNLEKITGKQLCQSLLFNKVAGLRTVNLLKKRFWYKCFPVNFLKFLKTPSIIEHLRWLLLKTPVNQLIFWEELVDLQLFKRIGRPNFFTGSFQIYVFQTTQNNKMIFWTDPTFLLLWRRTHPLGR